MPIDQLPQALLQGIMWGLFYALFASGLTILFAVTRLFNFAHGDLMVLAMYGCLVLYTYFGVDPYLALVVTIPLLGGLGVLVYNYLIKRVLHSHFAMVLQLTLGIVILLENVVLMVFKGDPLPLPTFISLKMVSLGPLLASVPLMIASAVAIVGLGSLYWILRNTDFGRSIRAISQDALAAQLMGIKIDRVRMIVFAIAFALLAVSGSCAAPIFILTPFIGLHLTLFAFIVVTLGGLGNFLGTILGGLTLGIAESVGCLLLGGDEALILVYGVFLLVLLFKPEGFLGERIEVTLR